MDNERVARLEEQGRWMAKEIHDVKSDLKEIKSDIKSLLAFKWKFAGALIVVMTAIEIAKAMGGK